MAVSAKTKNPKIGKATGNILKSGYKSIPGGKDFIINRPIWFRSSISQSSCKFISIKVFIINMSNSIKELYDYDLIKKCTKCEAFFLKNFYKQNIPMKDIK